MYLKQYKSPLGETRSYCSMCLKECGVVEIREYETTEQFGNIKTDEHIYEESDCCRDDVYYVTSSESEKVDG